MNLRERRERRQKRIDNILRIIENKQELSRDTREKVKSISNDIRKQNEDYELQLEFSDPLNQEAFSWPPGTVRGIITLWIVLMFCIICIWNFMTGLNVIPIEWFMGIVGLVIGSYFYSKYKMKV
jgi:hypothetical protein